MSTRDPSYLGESWLDELTQDYQADLSAKQRVRPFTMTLDGEVTNITIDHVKDDQLDVILLVVENIKKWIESAKGINKKDAKEYKPLRMTVRGAAGSGKSFFIKALENTVREMFGDQNAVHISAPTGSSSQRRRRNDTQEIPSKSTQARK